MSYKEVVTYSNRAGYFEHSSLIRGVSANCSITRTVTWTAGVNQKVLQTAEGKVEVLYLKGTILIYPFCIRHLVDKRT